MPSIFLGLGLKERIGEFQIPPSQDVLVKKTQNGYLATTFLSINLEPVQPTAQPNSSSFAKAISSIRSPCKLSVLLYNPDLSSVLDELKARRSLAENKKSQLLLDQHKNAAQIAVLEREISMWTSQINKLANGEKPIQSLAFVSTTAYGDSFEEAQTKSRSQANEIKAIFANALSARVSILRGEEMKKCFEWEYAIPETATEIKEETS